MLIEGISIWPTELLRLAACGLAVAFIFRGCQMLKKNTAEINAEFFPQQNLVPQKSDTSSSSWKRMEHDDSPVDMLKLWCEYLYHCRPRRVSWRVIRTSSIFSVLSVLLVILDLPMAPYRGELSLWVDRTVLALSIASFVVLLFFVLDQIRLCDRLVRVLYAGTSAWPKETLQKQSVKNNSGREWIDIQFVAKRTEEIGKLVYYPFVVLVLLIVARSSLFDHWYLPYGLAAVFVLSLLCTIAVAIQLRRSAEHARSIALQRLSHLKLQHLGARKTNDLVQKQTEEIIAEISAIRTGAFRPLTEQPLVQAILIPLGGYGSISLIEYLAFLK